MDDYPTRYGLRYGFLLTNIPQNRLRSDARGWKHQSFFDYCVHIWAPISRGVPRLAKIDIGKDHSTSNVFPLHLWLSNPTM